MNTPRDVDRDHPPELLQREVFDESGVGDACVVDKNIECAEMLCGAADCSPNGFRVGAVSLYRQGAGLLPEPSRDSAIRTTP